MSRTVSESTIAPFLIGLQKGLVGDLQSLDTALRPVRDEWKRPGGGGGASIVLAEGEIIEKGGVNFSDVRGDRLPAAASARRPQLAGLPFRAMGVSVVIHPRNPYAPTAHMNVRYFQTGEGDQPGSIWFGGGFDLTPYYPFAEDVRAWHLAAKAACSPLGGDAYPRYKAECDTYFHLPHRRETRGIGGLFYDDLCEPDLETAFAFTRSVGETFRETYVSLLKKRAAHPYGERERAFQLYRRGRYVEFNLLYDRGTLFGLQSQGRTESILMSLPPLVRWEYDWHPEPGSPEEILYRDYLRPRDWLNELPPQ